MRDDFAANIKGILAARTGYSCSNPGCRAITSGPQANEQRATNVGVAAHITAAIGGGPRYDPNLSSEQRSGILNGIWLCQTCAHAIDADQTRYSVAILYHWKLEAEHAAHQELGRPRSTTQGTTLNQIPQETIRIVQDRKNSRWSTGSNGETPIMFVNFHGTITEVSGKVVKVVRAEIPSPPVDADMILVCNDHDAQRPQFLRPHEVANLSVTFMLSSINIPEVNEVWTSLIVLIDQFGNRHELPDCQFLNSFKI